VVCRYRIGQRETAEAPAAELARRRPQAERLAIEKKRKAMINSLRAREISERKVDCGAKVPVFMKLI